MPQVSVIIPVFRVQPFMERCAVSLFSQTLEDIEYIFVDDCSPDDSIAILRSVLSRFPARILQTRIERMPVNSGLAAVRKKGLKLATGDYIITCDSDDYVDIHMYETLYRTITREQADLVQCDIEVRDGDKTIRTLTAPPGEPDSETLRKLIVSGRISNSVCNKLVRRDLYQRPDFLFPAGDLDEDNVMSVQLACYAGKLAYVRQPFYKACRNPGSVTQKPGKEQTRKRLLASRANSRIIVGFLRSHGYGPFSRPVVKARMRPVALRLREFLRKLRSR